MICIDLDLGLAYLDTGYDIVDPSAIWKIADIKSIDLGRVELHSVGIFEIRFTNNTRITYPYWNVSNDIIETDRMICKVFNQMKKRGQNEE